MHFEFYSGKPEDAVSAILNIVIGLILFIFKGGILSFAGTLFGVLLIIAGAGMLGAYFWHIGGGITMAGGLFALAIGLYFMINPGFVVSIIPMFIGALLLVNGIRSLMTSLEFRNAMGQRWIVSLAIAIAYIAFGILCLTNAFGIMEKALQLVGIVLIANGIYSLIINRKNGGNGGDGGNYGSGWSGRKNPDDDIIDVNFR